VRIDGPDSLRAHLQTAIQIEWSTIPPYLCALWSLGDVHNRLAATCLREVVMEEMLHLTLVANILNALDRDPCIAPDTAPRYPGPLPHSDRSFDVSLLPFCPEALETFRRIEHPALIGAPPQPDRWTTIAQFYEALREAVCRIGADQKVWSGDPARQVRKAQYYGGGGEVIEVDGREAALEAIKIIIEEGEGFAGGITDGGHLLGEPEELAHYYRFDELARGRRYVRGDKPSHPTGAPILLDYSAVAPMRPNPRAEDYPPDSELRAMTAECDATYVRLLGRLQSAFTGRPDELADAVPEMWALEFQAIALMRIPVDDGEHTAGPAFAPPAA
jgi:hypothetical protein